MERTIHGRLAIACHGRMRRQQCVDPMLCRRQQVNQRLESLDLEAQRQVQQGHMHHPAFGTHDDTTDGIARQSNVMTGRGFKIVFQEKLPQRHDIIFVPTR